MPVLPPTDESTCASSVVGICTNRIPRMIDRCGETCHVADDAAAERHDEALAVGTALDQRVENSRHGTPVLVGLAVGQNDRQDLADSGERMAHSLRIEAFHRGTGDECDARWRERRNELRRSPQQIRADQNVVGTARQGDRHALHRTIVRGARRPTHSVAGQ